MILTKADRGWSWIVMLSSFGNHCIGGYFQYASGLIHLVLLETYQKSVLQTSWISAIFLALISFVGPIASVLITKFSCRASMMVGAVLQTSGLICTAFTTDFNSLYFTLGLLFGTGLGICYNTAVIVLGFNFEKKRNMACGFAISGAGIGPFILTPVFEFIRKTYHASGLFLILAGLSLQNCIFAMTFRDSEIEQQTRKHHLKHTPGLKDLRVIYLNIFKNKYMFCLCLSLMLVSISVFLLYLHFPKFYLQTNSTEMDVSLYLSLAGICSAVGKVLFGMANNSEDIDESITMFGIFSVLGVITFLFPYFRFYSFAKVILTSFLGFYSGCCWLIMNTVVIQILGYEKLAFGIGYIMVFVGIGCFLGPPLAGLILEVGGTYGDSFQVAGCLFIIGAFLWLVPAVHIGRQEKPKLNYDLPVQIRDEKLTLNHEVTEQMLSDKNTYMMGKLDIELSAKSAEEYHLLGIENQKS